MCLSNKVNHLFYQSPFQRRTHARRNALRISNQLIAYGGTHALLAIPTADVERNVMTDFNDGQPLQSNCFLCTSCSSHVRSNTSVSGEQRAVGLFRFTYLGSS